MRQMGFEVEKSKSRKEEKKMATVLLAGGAGYIGSHTAVELLNNGHEVVVVDNFYNSSPESIKRVEQITGKTVKLYEGDVKDHSIIRTIFKENKIDCVIHFAGLKAVGESVAKPIVSIFLIKKVLSSELYFGRIVPNAIITLLFGLMALLYSFKGTKVRFNKEYLQYGLKISVPLVLHGIAL